MPTHNTDEERIAATESNARARGVLPWWGRLWGMIYMWWGPTVIHTHEMTDEEYDRLHPIIRGNLTEEERLFFAKEVAIVCDFSAERERGWKRLAFFFGAVSGLLFIVLVWWVL